MFIIKFLFVFVISNIPIEIIRKIRKKGLYPDDKE